MKNRHFFSALILAGAVFMADAATPKRQKPVADPPPGVEVLRNLVYKEPFIRPLELDLYRPAKFDRNLPVVVWVHGGGWLNGSKGNCPAAWLRSPTGKVSICPLTSGAGVPEPAT